VATYQEYHTAVRVGAAGLESLPAIIRAQGDRASPRFIEFFTATILNRNTLMAYARVKTLLRLVP
jgi:hypothetical protein